ncbi:MAG: hypothetical protein DME04_06355 [Candidatus Rokuibacteriota bacterium]|nr:MAG: hypothetical protein DME04_06355 [Candidatus Rokubacteria bacterium]
MTSSTALANADRTDRRSSRSSAPKIRLLQITHDLAIGGLQQVVVNLCRTLNRSIFDIEVLCLRAPGEFAPEIERLGIPVTVLPQNPRHTDYFSFLKVAKFLRDRKFDVIHTHNTQPLVDGTLGGLLVGGVRTIVHTDHARQFPDKRRYMFAEWVLSHWVYRIVGVSNETSKNLVDYEKISPKKIVTIRNGVVGDTFQRPINKFAKRAELGIPSSAPVIGLAARLTEQKGLTFLLQALPAVLRAQRDLRLVIAGDGPLRRNLEEEAQRVGVGSHVHFLGPRTDMPDILQLFDVYVLPSIWEGLPMVLLEAMAAGCPIVATNVGGNPDAVRDGYNGYLVPARDPDALATRVIGLLSDRRQREEFGRNGRTLFDREFSAAIMARSYEQLYLRHA